MLHTRKYKLSPKTMAHECSVSLFVIPILGNIFCLGWYSYNSVGTDNSDFLSSVLPTILGLLIILFTIFAILLLIIPMGRVIFSHLTLSAEGLEYRLWPLHRVSSTWNDVEQIKKSPLLSQGDILTLKNAEVSGFHLLLDFQKGNFGTTKTVPMIPLYKFTEWPNGSLEEALRQYAPGLFLQQPLL